MNPKEVLALIRSKEVKAVDLRFMDFPGFGSTSPFLPKPLKNPSSKKASASTDPASAAGRPSTNPTCSCIPVPETAFIDPF